MQGVPHTAVWYGTWGVLYEPVHGKWVKIAADDIDGDNTVSPARVASIVRAVDIQIGGDRTFECCRVLRRVEEPIAQPEEALDGTARRKKRRRQKKSGAGG